MWNAKKLLNTVTFSSSGRRGAVWRRSVLLHNTQGHILCNNLLDSFAYRAICSPLRYRGDSTGTKGTGSASSITLAPHLFPSRFLIRFVPIPGRRLSVRSPLQDSGQLIIKSVLEPW